MTRLVLTWLVIAGMIAACDSSDAPPTAEPGRAVQVPELVAAAAANDGRPVRVTGFFLMDRKAARLCEVSLESYPPQCGCARVLIVGEVAPAVLAVLSHTEDPGLAVATWGWVVVTGTFRATGPGGDPAIEIGEVILAEG